MVIYNIQNNGDCSQLVIELINDTIHIDASSVAYISGNINVDAQDDSFSRRFKSHFAGKSVFKQKFNGTGKIYLYATLGTYHKFTLKEDQELFINPKVFMVCRDSIVLKPHLNVSFKGFISGMPLVNLHMKGTGSIIILMPGPVQELLLEDEKFSAIGKEVAAYSTTLERTREIIGKSWISGPSMAQVFRGTGSVYFSPIPNKDSKSRISKD